MDNIATSSFDEGLDFGFNLLVQLANAFEVGIKGLTRSFFQARWRFYLRFDPSNRADVSLLVLGLFSGCLRHAV